MTLCTNLREKKSTTIRTPEKVKWSSVCGMFSNISSMFQRSHDPSYDVCPWGDSMWGNSVLGSFTFTLLMGRRGLFTHRFAGEVSQYFSSVYYCINLKLPGSSVSCLSTDTGNPRIIHQHNI